MANFPGLVFTDAGRDILAKAIAGQPLVFTRVALGSGADPGPADALTGLVSEELNVQIESFEMVGDGTSKIRAVVTNANLDTGFFAREIGIFAQDPDTLVDVLYAYSNAGGQADFMPASGGATVVEQVLDLYAVISNASNVSAVINEFITLATVAMVDELRPFLLPDGGLEHQLLRKASDANGDAEWVDPNVALGARVTLIGPDLVFPGSSNTYTITNFDDFSTYAVSTNVGTVSRSDEVITLDIGAGETAEGVILSIERDGATATYQLAIGAQSVAQPSILSPADGATNVGETPTLTTSGFQTYPGGADTHASTDWQVATDSGFTAVVFESLADASNLEAITVPTATLSESTTYYVRARHNGSTLGASPYSATVSFTTDASFFNQDQVVAQWNVIGHPSVPSATALGYIPSLNKFLLSDSNLSNDFYLLDYSDPTVSTVFATTAEFERVSGLVFDGTDVWTCEEGGKFLRYTTSGQLVETLTVNYLFPTALAFDGTNLITYSQDDYLIRVHSGKTMSVASSFAAPSANLAGLTVHNGDLYSSDSGTDKIYKHLGISGTIDYSFAAPDNNPRGLVFAQGTMFSVGSGTGANVLYKHGEA